MYSREMEVEAMVTVVAAAAAPSCMAVRSMQKVPRSSPRYYRPNSSAIGASPPPAAQPLFSHHLFRLCALLCPPKTVPIYDPEES